jgi:hypothetical protein
MTDHRISLNLFLDILDVLHQHGFTQDDEHVSQAIAIIGGLAPIYEGTQGHPNGPSIYQALSQPLPPEPPAQHSRDAVILPASDRKTMLTALDIAADHMRDRAELCTDCPGQSCTTCQTRLHDAQAYDQLADRILHGAAPAADHGQGEPASPPRPAGPAADKEAGQ